MSQKRLAGPGLELDWEYGVQHYVRLKGKKCLEKLCGWEEPCTNQFSTSKLDFPMKGDGLVMDIDVEMDQPPLLVLKILPFLKELESTKTKPYHP